MIKIIFLAVVLLLPVHITYGHPGKTDYRGGHRCWKNCGGWNIGYGEYHLHDEAWNPVRLDKNGNPAKQLKPQDLLPLPANHELTVPPEAAPVNSPAGKDQKNNPADKKTFHTDNYNLTIYEESILPFDFILLILLALLLLIVLILIRGEDTKKNSKK